MGLSLFKINYSQATLNFYVLRSCHISHSRGSYHGYTCVPSTMGGAKRVK